MTIDSTTERLAIKSGVDPIFFQGGELNKFRKACEDDYKSRCVLKERVFGKDRYELPNEGE